MTITVVTPETDPHNHGHPQIFLAGGITGCPDWQADAIQMLTELGPDNLVIANPRRQHPIPPEGPETSFGNEPPF
ncbi:hypothetical protein [Actinomyces succiniciruminis]|uniref:Uncharacterized protein n=1 Tax=Actinomyces succiniciruminis TaxID=1522002 RepID=A0A1L7REG1_9ACTO|nr:hypothetical protein [Actinomyces succiniciruminis]CED92441.1 Hypothetical protein AAM4_2609 [Actinomyces succiniciruminis]